MRSLWEQRAPVLALGLPSRLRIAHIAVDYANTAPLLVPFTLFALCPH